MRRLARALLLFTSFLFGWWAARKAREVMDFYLWERELAVAQEVEVE